MDRVGINTKDGFAVMQRHGVRLEGLPGISAMDEPQFDALMSKVLGATTAAAVEALLLPYRGGWA